MQCLADSRYAVNLVCNYIGVLFLDTLSWPYFPMVLGELSRMPGTISTSVFQLLEQRGTALRSSELPVTRSNQVESR